MGKGAGAHLGYSFSAFSLAALSYRICIIFSLMALSSDFFLLSFSFRSTIFSVLVTFLKEEVRPVRKPHCREWDFLRRETGLEKVRRLSRSEFRIELLLVRRFRGVTRLIVRLSLGVYDG